MNKIKWLNPLELDFPSIHCALDEPNGLVAAGGDLSPERLLLAYKRGIFPWYEEGQPILWWSPNPRAILFPQDIKISRSLYKKLNANKFEIRLDTAFADVVRRCGDPREYAEGTWLTDDMSQAYQRLHDMGLAHSVECFQEGELVGGLYGVSLGRLFFGESMFHQVTDASKVALAWLCRLMVEVRCPLIDCQVPNDHLTSLGAIEMERDVFENYLMRYAGSDVEPIDWQALSTRPGSW
ncbi:MAG: leucyl/phenylalanyl-tRNA--protein transferase [Pseudomonadales bacterium]